jgi:hypothetical protein
LLPAPKVYTSPPCVKHAECSPPHATCSARPGAKLKDEEVEEDMYVIEEEEEEEEQFCSLGSE